MRVRASTAEAVWLDEPEVTWVRVVLADGRSIGIRQGHAPLLAETAPGTLQYGTEAGAHSVDIDRGILQVHREGVDIYAAAGGRSSRSQDSAPDDDSHSERLARAMLKLLRAGTDAYSEREA
jgi:F0F1-type ATP synthase epsilon subunit